MAAAPRLLLITPISASKRHLPFDELTKALALPRNPDTRLPTWTARAYGFARCVLRRAPAAQLPGVGAVDIAVCSADKHVAGPRAGVLVGRKDLITQIGSVAYDAIGLEAQAGCAVRRRRQRVEELPIRGW